MNNTEWSQVLTLKSERAEPGAVLGIVGSRCRTWNENAHENDHASDHGSDRGTWSDPACDPPECVSSWAWSLPSRRESARSHCCRNWNWKRSLNDGGDHVCVPCVDFYLLRNFGAWTWSPCWSPEIPVASGFASLHRSAFSEPYWPCGWDSPATGWRPCPPLPRA